MWRASTEFARWRDQRWIDKRAEVAGECAVAAVRFCEAAADLAIDVFVNPERTPNELRHEWLARVLSARRQDDTIEEIRLDFLKAQTLALVYLPSEVSELLEELRLRRIRLVVDQDSCVRALAHSDKDDSLLARALGDQPRAEFERLKSRVLALLKPMIEMATTRVRPVKK